MLLTDGRRIVSIGLLALLAASSWCWAAAAADDAESGAESSPESADPALLEYAKTIAGKTYYTSYIGDIRIGWSEYENKLIEENGRVLLRRSFLQISKMKRYGLPTARTIKGSWQGMLRGEGSADYFEVEEEKQSLGNTDLHSYRIEDDNGKLSISTYVNGERRTISTGRSSDTLLQEIQILEWLNGERKPGDISTWKSFSYQDFSEESETPDVDTEYVYRGLRTIEWKGEHRLVHVISVSSEGDTLEQERFSDGTMYSLRAGIVRNQREDGPPDYDFEVEEVGESFLAKQKPPIRNSHFLDELRIQITTEEELKPFNTRRQKFVKNERGYLVTLLPGCSGQTEDSLLAEDKEKYTRATSEIQSDNADIVGTSRRIVGAEKDTLKKIELLNDWVYLNILPTTASDTTSAVRVLENREGDCSECALLFVALARAAGIPAREVGGLKYSEPDNAWIGHGWAQVHDGHEWVSVDPSWGQLRVDTTYILLSIEEEASYQVFKLFSSELETVSLRYESLGAWCRSQEPWARCLMLTAAVSGALVLLIALTSVAWLMMKRRRKKGGLLSNSGSPLGGRWELFSVFAAKFYAAPLIMILGCFALEEGEDFVSAGLEGVAALAVFCLAPLVLAVLIAAAIVAIGHKRFVQTVLKATAVSYFVFGLMEMGLLIKLMHKLARDHSIDAGAIANLFRGLAGHI